MTAPDLVSLIPNIPWFSKLGESPFPPSVIILRILPETDGGEWDSLATVLFEQEPLREITASWNWLPTTHQEPDPIHGDTHVRRCREMGRDAERRTAELAASQAVLRGLRAIPRPHPGLKAGPHDLTEAARNSAVFAARMATRERITDAPGFWVTVMSIYAAGHWPCGLHHRKAARRPVIPRLDHSPSPMVIPCSPAPPS